MEVIQCFNGTESDKVLLRVIINEWNTGKYISSLFDSWTKGKHDMNNLSFTIVNYNIHSLRNHIAMILTFY